MNIIDLIPFDHYITRQELSAATGMSDRSIREEIHRLRTESPETLIMSSSKNRGYKRPSSYDELIICKDECTKRIKAELKKIQTIDIVLRNRDQLGLGMV